MIRSSWDGRVESLDFLPVGFGGHHWRARTPDGPDYFVIVADLAPRHSAGSLTAAYAGAVALARAGLGFVVAPLSPVVVPFADRALSLTRWLDGTTPAATDLPVTAAMLADLHAVDPARLGVSIPAWQPVIGPDLVDRIRAELRRPWSGGPYGPDSHQALTGALDDIGHWTVRYHELATVARTRRWVLTHGEPGWHNQLVTVAGTVLVDWETLKMAPAERDLLTVGSGEALMVEMFDLEWRLGEIAEYLTWFAGPHGDTADDRLAYTKLLHELGR